MWKHSPPEKPCASGCTKYVQRGIVMDSQALDAQPAKVSSVTAGRLGFWMGCTGQHLKQGGHMSYFAGQSPVFEQLSEDSPLFEGILYLKGQQVWSRSVLKVKNHLGSRLSKYETHLVTVFLAMMKCISVLFKKKFSVGIYAYKSACGNVLQSSVIYSPIFGDTFLLSLSKGVVDTHMCKCLALLLRLSWLLLASVFCLRNSSYSNLLHQML